MKTLFDAFRSLIYASGFFALFIWIALQLRVHDTKIDARMDAKIGSVPHAVVPVGLIFMCAGAVLAILCIATFVVRGRGTPAIFDPPTRFVAAGPYRYVRNPMYIGGFAFLLG
ncbi:MAG: methyltransferase, partial [Candidatus Acidiferrales bacterium]